MRIALLTGIFPPDIGGPATHSSVLADELRRRGHEVVIVTAHNRPRPQSCDLVSFPRSWPWPLRHISHIGWLVRHRGEYDVIYATGLLMPATVAARLARRPVVVKIVGDPAWERARRHNLTTASFDEFQSQRGGSLRLRLMRISRNRSVAVADAVIAPSEYLVGIIRGWSRSARVVVIRNGVEVTDSVDPESSQRRHVPLRAIFVGRLVAHKRIDVLLRAIHAVDGVSLEIVGEGPENEPLHELAADLGVRDRVTFVGGISHQQVLSRIRAADVLVSASSYEGLPHTHLEALVCGRPVITAPAGGTTEAIIDGLNGVVVDPSTPERFATELQRLRDDPDQWERLSRQALESSQAWRFPHCADQIERLLQRQVSDDRPLVVFLGKTALAGSSAQSLQNKVQVHERHIRSVWVAPESAKDVALEGVSRARVPAAGRRGGWAFYALAPLVALKVAVGPRGVRPGAGIVCQSPFEAFGVLLYSRALPQAYRPPVQIELHGDWRTASRLYGRSSRRVVAPVADRAARWALRRADRVRAVSELLAHQARDAGCTAPIDIHVAYSDYTGFLAEAPTPMPTGQQVAFVGVFERYKAVDVLLAAWEQVVAELPEARLVMVGTGSQYESVARRIAAGLMARSVTLAGHVPRSQVRDVIDGSRCLALPSRSEGLPRIVIEAMARARPVVATPVGGVPEVIRDRQNGRLVPVDDADALATALIDLLADRESAQHMGQEARRWVDARDPAVEYDKGIQRLGDWLRCV